VGLARRIGLNTTWLGLARLVTQAQLAIFTILAARRLGGAVFGEYALITSLVAIANVLTTFGTDTLLIREVAGGREDRRAWAGAALALQLGLSGLVIAWALAGAAVYPNLNPVELAGLRLYALSLLPLAFFSVSTALLRGEQRMDLYLLANLALVTVQTAGAWVILSRLPGLLPLLCWLLITQTGGAVFAALACRAAGFPGFSLRGVDRRRVARVARIAWPLAAISLLGIVYQRLGVLVLAPDTTSAQVGWFAAAARSVEALKLGHVAVLGALLPAISKLHADASASLARRLFWQVFGLLAAASMLAAGFLAAAARPLVSLLLGPEYLPAVPLLQIMGWSLLPYTVSACLSVWEVAHRREQRLLFVVAVTTAFSLAAYVLLVRALGLSGAAWAYLAGETVQAIVFVSIVGVSRHSENSAPPAGVDGPQNRAAKKGVSEEMNEVQENTPVFSAADLLAERWRRGRRPSAPPPEAVVLCYQRDLLAYVRHKHIGKPVAGFLGEVYALKGGGGRVAVAGNFGIGAPAAVIQLEELAAFGARRFLSIGLAGSLQPEAAPGDWLVCDGAARDEGASRHYLPAALRIDADRELVETLQASLAAWGVPLHTGPVWTTDAPFRETRREVQTWQGEGVCAVDMETAGLLAASRALGVSAGAALVLADQVSVDGWIPPADPHLVQQRLRQLMDAALQFLMGDGGRR
jgi:O-antigen/teichoic acid export membrane protein/uridine phosphorylase